MSDIIQVICGELTTSFDNEVMKAVQQVGINVNKEELLKALELADKLVRCKDCRHKYVTGHTTQYYVCDFMDAQFDENGYCHHGERKEE